MCMHSIALDKSLGQTKWSNVRKYLSIFQNDIFRPNMCSIDLPSPEITFESRPVISMGAASCWRPGRSAALPLVFPASLSPAPHCTNSSTWHPESVPGNFVITCQAELSGSTPLLRVYVCAHMCVWLELTSDWVITIIQTGPLPSYLHSASSAVFISTTTELLQSFNYLDNSPFFLRFLLFFFLPPWVVSGFQWSSPYGSNQISAIGGFLTFSSPSSNLGYPTSKTAQSEDRSGGRLSLLINP